MALLERITTMKQQGISEAQIINTLSEEGVSPREINEALSQSKIKAAVSSDEGMQQSVMTPANTEQQYAPVPEVPRAKPLTYAQEQTSYPPAQQTYVPQETYAQDQTQYAPEAYPQDQTQYAQGYSQEGYYQQGADIETIKDIAKQVVEESLLKMKDELQSLSKMKSDLKFEIQDIENRLVRIENIIQELQTSIIRRMGQYGESIAGISQEIKATQESFSKMINPILDKKRNLSEESSEQTEEGIPEQRAERQKPTQKQPSSRTTSASGIGVEDYFR